MLNAIAEKTRQTEVILLDSMAVDWIDAERKACLSEVIATYNKLMEKELSNQLGSVSYLDNTRLDALNNAYIETIENVDRLFSVDNIPAFFKSTFYHHISRQKFIEGKRGKVYTSLDTGIDCIDKPTMKREANDKPHQIALKAICFNVKKSKRPMYCRLYIRRVIYGQRFKTIAKALQVNRRTINRYWGNILDIVGTNKAINRLHADYWEANSGPSSLPGNGAPYPDNVIESKRAIACDLKTGKEIKVKTYKPRNKLDKHGEVKHIKHNHDKVKTLVGSRAVYLPITAKVSNQNNKPIKGQLSLIERQSIALTRNGLNTPDNMKMLQGIKPITSKFKALLETIDYSPIHITLESDSYYHWDKDHLALFQGDSIADM